MLLIARVNGEIHTMRNIKSGLAIKIFTGAKPIARKEAPDSKISSRKIVSSVLVAILNVDRATCEASGARIQDSFLVKLSDNYTWVSCFPETMPLQNIVFITQKLTGYIFSIYVVNTFSPLRCARQSAYLDDSGHVRRRASNAYHV